MIDPDEKPSAAEEPPANEQRGTDQEKPEEREDPFALDPLGPPGGRPW